MLGEDLYNMFPDMPEWGITLLLWIVGFIIVSWGGLMIALFYLTLKAIL